MTDKEKTFLVKLAEIGNETNKKICKMADEYGYDRNEVMAIFLKIYAKTNAEFDFTKGY